MKYFLRILEQKREGKERQRLSCASDNSLSMIEEFHEHGNRNGNVIKFVEDKNTFQLDLDSGDDELFYDAAAKGPLSPDTYCNYFCFLW